MWIHHYERQEMDIKEHNWPAFPYSTKNASGTDKQICGVNVPNGCQVDFPGMTLRDYFAAKAMQSLILKATATVNASDMALPNAVSVGAYQYADAMLAERAK